MAEKKAEVPTKKAEPVEKEIGAPVKPATHIKVNPKRRNSRNR